MSFLDESTLGTGLAKRSRRSESAATSRVIRDAVPHRSSLGTGFIGIGATIIFALRAVYGLGWLVVQWDSYPSPITALTSWLLLTVVVVSTIMIDKGKTIKRFLPRSRGRADVILKRMSHITVVVEEKA